MNKEFQRLLYPAVAQIVGEFDTAAHILTEQGIMKIGGRLIRAFWGLDYNNFFAVKACPNPAILKIMMKLGFGFDCSSIVELRLVRSIGAKPDKIMFTSNNTSLAEFKEALAHGGCILNLDDISLIKKVPGKFPEFICFRYNPGGRRTGNSIIGEPAKAKYGITDAQFLDAYRFARARGAKRFGFHMMICSNERRCGYFVDTIKMALEKAALLKRELGIEVEFINIGGGFGIPYRPDKKCKELNIELIGRRARTLFARFAKENGFRPRFFTECGRYITGPNGVIVCRIINRKDIYQTYLGVDSGMPDLMRPAMYGAYHHIHILTPRGNLRRGGRRKLMNIVGSICENCDRFTAKPRLFPASVKVGDLVVVHDTGAHGIAMGFNYNGRKRSQELLIRLDGSVVRIGRAQTDSDLLRTYQSRGRSLKLKKLARN